MISLLNEGGIEGLMAKRVHHQQAHYSLCFVKLVVVLYGFPQSIIQISKVC